MPDERRLQWSLLALRLGVFTVFLVWTLDKIFNYQHNSGMVKGYYNVEVAQWFLLSVGIAELVLLIIFLAGKFKTLTYGVLLIAHTVTTLASSWQLLPPYEKHQLLYFGSLPMLAACFALFMMREYDTLWNCSD